MGKESNNPEKYYRTGIALPMAQKPTLDARLGELGLKTTGELASMFVNADGIVEALKPIVEAWKASKSLTGKGLAAERRRAIDQIKAMSPEQIAAVLRAAQAGQAGE